MLPSGLTPVSLIPSVSFQSLALAVGHPLTLVVSDDLGKPGIVDADVVSVPDVPSSIAVWAWGDVEFITIWAAAPIVIPAPLPFPCLALSLSSRAKCVSRSQLEFIAWSSGVGHPAIWACCSSPVSQSLPVSAS